MTRSATAAPPLGLGGGGLPDRRQDGSGLRSDALQRPGQQGLGLNRAGAPALEVDDGAGDGIVAEDAAEACTNDAYVKGKIHEYIRSGAWKTADALYFTLPNAALLVARGLQVEPSAWQFNECKVYVLDWSGQFPAPLAMHCGSAGPPCPTCYAQRRPGESDRDRLERAAACVNPSGWAKNPRHFLDTESYHFVYSRNYRCSTCEGNFLAHDVRLLPLLPEVLRLMMPCVFTPKVGVSNAIKLQLERFVITERSSFEDLALRLCQMTPVPRPETFYGL